MRQNVGLPCLLPVAPEVLRDDPMAEGRTEAGDLLGAVISGDPAPCGTTAELGHELRRRERRLLRPRRVRRAVRRSARRPGGARPRTPR
ncbi:contact-dependent growth inhibition system immunity protein [Streptomyces sp. NPDC088157]